MLYSVVPIFKLLGTPFYIDSNVPYDVNSDVQLVCKYLHAYKTRNIDCLYNERSQKEVKFSQSGNLSTSMCNSLLSMYMPDHIANSKITQHLFIR